MSYFTVDHDIYFSLSRGGRELYVNIMSLMNGSGNDHSYFGVAVFKDECVTTKSILMKAMGMDYRDDKSRSRFKRWMKELSHCFSSETIVAQCVGNRALRIKNLRPTERPTKRPTETMEQQRVTGCNRPTERPTERPTDSNSTYSNSIDSKVQSAPEAPAEPQKPSVTLNIYTLMNCGVIGAWQVEKFNKNRSAIQKLGESYSRERIMHSVALAIEAGQIKAIDGIPNLAFMPYIISDYDKAWTAAEDSRKRQQAMRDETPKPQPEKTPEELAGIEIAKAEAMAKFKAWQEAEKEKANGMQLATLGRPRL